MEYIYSLGYLKKRKGFYGKQLIETSVLKWHYLGPVYTGPDKFLLGRILFLDDLFTRIRANSVTDCSGVYTDPCKF